jgi:uncharacterized protein YuzE
MKLIYDADTDALYLKLKDGRVEESEEVAPGFVLDFDAEGNVLGVDIDAAASEKVDLSLLETEGLRISLTHAEPRQDKAV